MYESLGHSKHAVICIYKFVYLFFYLLYNIYLFMLYLFTFLIQILFIYFFINK